MKKSTSPRASFFIIVAAIVFSIHQRAQGENTASNMVNMAPTSNNRIAKSQVTNPSLSRKIFDGENLKEIKDKLCTKGFKAYIGAHKKNVCRGWATPPNIAYSCVWNEKGNPVYPMTPQGPCKLDFTEHRGSLIVTKQLYKSHPALQYGTEVQCCSHPATKLDKE